MRRKGALLTGVAAVVVLGGAGVGVAVFGGGEPAVGSTAPVPA